MSKLTHLLTLVLAAGILMFGCSHEPNPVQPGATGLGDEPFGAAMIAQATVQSATFYIYVAQPSGQTVNVHRITSAWSETEVTWNNFGGAYAPGITGSFAADGMGWRSVDVTSLVQDWMDGMYENYGLLLDQVDMVFPRTIYNSRENAENQPYLEVCFTGGGCSTYPAVADAYIYERNPDGNRGLSTILFTGWGWDTDLEKQALVRFELPPEEEYGECEGKVSQLTLRYDGSIVDAHVVILQRRGAVAFDGIVQPGEQFTFVGLDRKGTLGPEIDVYINGAYHTYIHTSCSQPIGPGLVRGDFTVIEGYSRLGGLLPPL